MIFKIFKKIILIEFMTIKMIMKRKKIKMSNHG